MSPWRRLIRPARSYVDDRIVRWRTGTSEGQLTVGLVIGAVTLLLLVVSWHQYELVAAAWFVVPMLLGALTLRHRPLIVLLVFIGACVAATVTRESLADEMTPARISTLAAMVVIAAVVLFDSSHRRTGLPGTVGEGMLVDLRDRLQAQGTIPELPAGWSSESAMKYAGGAHFSGDFMVSRLSDDGTRLEMVLVDVCGKGVAAGTRSLQLAGALGGLIGALPPMGLFSAANDYLLHQKWDDGFATAVHVLVDLQTGGYSIISAGHPPALLWQARTGEWAVDGARGLALGIAPLPEFHQTEGVLHHGDALMFYTDGVVESKSRDVMSGVDWLRERARQVASAGFGGLTTRIIAEVDPGDDRALLVLAHLDPSELDRPFETPPAAHGLV